MKKIVTKYGTLKVYKNVITIDANPSEVNKTFEKNVEGDVILEDHIRLELRDGWWYQYEDCTYWDDELDCWVRLLNDDGTPLAAGARNTLLEALWYAWVTIFQI